MLPPRSWMERPVFVSATSSVFEAYVPPEGDGKLSALTLGVNIQLLFNLCFLLIKITFCIAQGAKQSMELLSKKSKSMMAVRKIKSFEEDFSTKYFPEEAQEIYLKAHKALAE